MEEALLPPATSCSVPCRPLVIVASGGCQAVARGPKSSLMRGLLACRTELQLALCTPGSHLGLVTSWLVCVEFASVWLWSLATGTAMSTVTSRVERAQPYPITHL